MKSVLISIQPKWCELIASGKKTVEVRKTKPKLETPFKVYIYCTKAKEVLLDILKDGDEVYGSVHRGKTVFIKGTEGSICDMYGKRQKVIGVFVCDKILELAQNENGGYYIPKVQFGYACMTVAEARTYGHGKPLYAWHISDLKIYDKPRELSEFIKCPYPWDCGACDYFDGFEMVCKKIKRPPQSWCYVESEG